MYRNYQASNSTAINLDMAGGYTELASIQTNQGINHYEPTVVHFDTGSELLWTGNNRGSVVSMLGNGFLKYTAFQVNSQGLPVVDLLTFDDNLLSLSQNSLKCNTKQGLHGFELLNPPGHIASCMMFSRDGSVLVGGEFNGLFQVDVTRGQVLRSLDSSDEAQTMLLRGDTNTKFICCGDYSGNIVFRDPDKLNVLQKVNVHSAALSDFDVCGQSMMTSGFSHRAGGVCLDQFVKIYDLRMLRYVCPMKCAVRPDYLRYVSSYTRNVAMIAKSGQFLVIPDNSTVTPSTQIHQIRASSEILKMDISKTNHALCFADSGGFVHVWSSSQHTKFNKQSKELEFAPPPTRHRPTDFDDLTVSLASIPMPLCEGPLLSDWPPDFNQRVSRRHLPFDPQLMTSMNYKQGIRFAPNNNKRLRNQVPYRPQDMMVGKDKKGTSVSVVDNPVDNQPLIPEQFRKVAFKYTKLGDEEDEMVRRHNRTYFAGLDPNLKNAYCNCMLQVLFFIEPLRCFFQSRHNLQKEFELAEELGFLFHMQDVSMGGILQATNFLRAFRTIHEAKNLGLTQSYINNDVTSSSSTNDLPHMIQNWNRFILQQLHYETKPQALENQEPTSESNVRSNKFRNDSRNDPSKSIIEKVFGTELQVTTEFRNGKVTSASTVQFLFNLSYPILPKTETSETAEFIPFSKIIHDSICQRVNLKSWDNESNSFLPMVQQKTPSSLPEMLVLNCNVYSEDNIRFWTIQNEIYQEKVNRLIERGSSEPEVEHWRQQANQREIRNQKCNSKSSQKDEPMVKPSWVPNYISLIIDANQKLHVRSALDGMSEDTDPLIDETCSFANYELHASVAHVQQPKSSGNLIASINVSEPYHRRKEKVTHSQWYFFNEFRISSIDKEEAVDFDLRWKMPCILYYKKEDILSRNPYDIKFPFGPEILEPTPSLAKRTPKSSNVPKTVPLDIAELDSEKVLVALDAEFVTLNAEEAELHSDGTRSTIKPCQMLPARITVVRGQGPLEETPLIDDYIQTDEQVVDYLTQYSGIKPGDLDASLSSKHLSPLKLTYCKLRYLIHRGCIFVGHGLKKDFKVINIFVPDAQVRDTVKLFHVFRKRFISLRFLAWYFLGRKIQEEMHDSVEDAVTALRLYKKYQTLTDDGKKMDEFRNKILPALYEEGRKLDWKVPKEDPVQT